MKDVFDTVAAMWTNLAGACLVRGNRRMDTIEQVAVSATLTNPAACLFNNYVREPSFAYFGAELAWYLTGNPSIETLLTYAPSYINFSDDGVTAYGAYGFRGLSLVELENLADRMRANPLSRQHVIPLWRADDRGVKSKDVPCTVSLQFLNCGGYLDLIVYMRSNDLYLGFLYDVPCFCSIQLLMAKMLGLKVGYYHHNVGSLHIYDKDLDRIRAALLRPTVSRSVEVIDPLALIHTFEAKSVEMMADFIRRRTYVGN